MKSDSLPSTVYETDQATTRLAHLIGQDSRYLREKLVGPIQHCERCEQSDERSSVHGVPDNSSSRLARMIIGSNALVLAALGFCDNGSSLMYCKMYLDEMRLVQHNDVESAFTDGLSMRPQGFVVDDDNSRIVPVQG
jgi:hypothetical protein